VRLLLSGLALLAVTAAASAQGPFQESVVATSAGDLRVTFIGEASLMFRHNGVVV